MLKRWNFLKTGFYEGIKDCTLDPFTLNWRSDPEKLNDRFNKWLEEGLVVAMRYWYEFLEI